MSYEFQQHGRYYAQIPGGLEAEGAAELVELGAEDVAPAYRGAEFTASSAALYRVCYRARLASRVLAPLVSFPCRSADALYGWAREVAFGDFMEVTDSFAVHANVSGTRITHSQYAALRIKDALVDQFRERLGRRPDVERHEPDVAFHLHVNGARATLSLDASGGAMHRRHYRRRAVEAPMQENLAAAIVLLSGWDGERPLHDPFVGSGTLLAEALMRYSRIPALWLRQRFGFERLPGFDAELWAREKRAAAELQRPLPEGLLTGSDLDAEAIALARENLAQLPGGERVELRTSDFRHLPGLAGRVILANPPYGLRMGAGDDMPALYRDLGDFLKRRCPGSTAYVYVGARELLKQVGLRPASRRPLVNGALDGRLCRFDVFAGGWRDQDA